MKWKRRGHLTVSSPHLGPFFNKLSNKGNETPLSYRKTRVGHPHRPWRQLLTIGYETKICYDWAHVCVRSRSLTPGCRERCLFVPRTPPRLSASPRTADRTTYIIHIFDSTNETVVKTVASALFISVLYLRAGSGVGVFGKSKRQNPLVIAAKTESKPPLPSPLYTLLGLNGNRMLYGALAVVNAEAGFHPTHPFFWIGSSLSGLCDVYA